MKHLLNSKGGTPTQVKKLQKDLELCAGFLSNHYFLCLGINYICFGIAYIKCFASMNVQ